jgi:CBS domain-containing protein
MGTVRDILAKKGDRVFTITKDETVLAAAHKMNDYRIGALCVVEGDELIGMFTERDLLNRIVARERDAAKVKVGEVMSSPVITCGPTADLAHCAAVMSSQKIRHMPVVDEHADGKKLVGCLSTGDLMAMDVADKQTHIELLHDYLHGRT